MSLFGYGFSFRLAAFAGEPSEGTEGPLHGSICRSSRHRWRFQRLCCCLKWLRRAENDERGSVFDYLTNGQAVMHYNR